LSTVVRRRGVPGIAALSMMDGVVKCLGSAGVRRSGHSDSFLVDDPVHVGSLTKAMTATVLFDRFQGGLGAVTVGEALLSRFPGMDSRWREVTFAQLLSHTAGVPEVPGPIWEAAWGRVGLASSVQRAEYVKAVLASPPSGPPGVYSYSNEGYAIAASVLEPPSLEELFRTNLFDRLGMASAGFGAPLLAWGHTEAGEPVDPKGEHADNPPAIAAAGGVHCSLQDLALFGSWHASLPSGHALHQPIAAEAGYAMGWISLHRKWGGSAPVLTHSGSNTMWAAVIWVAPERGAVLVAAANKGGPEAHAACDEAIAHMIQATGLL
jgi:CubicO group peptidase (beta-lactamase class C family)